VKRNQVLGLLALIGVFLMCTGQATLLFSSDFEGSEEMFHLRSDAGQWQKQIKGVSSTGYDWQTDMPFMSIEGFNPQVKTNIYSPEPFVLDRFRYVIDRNGSMTRALYSRVMETDETFLADNRSRSNYICNPDTGIGTGLYMTYWFKMPTNVNELALEMCDPTGIVMFVPYTPGAGSFQVGDSIRFGSGLDTLRCIIDAINTIPNPDTLEVTVVEDGMSPPLNTEEINEVGGSATGTVNGNRRFDVSGGTFNSSFTQLWEIKTTSNPAEGAFNFDYRYNVSLNGWWPGEYVWWRVQMQDGPFADGPVDTTIDIDGDELLAGGVWHQFHVYYRQGPDAVDGRFFVQMNDTVWADLEHRTMDVDTLFANKYNMFKNYPNSAALEAEGLWTERWIDDVAFYDTIPGP
jgi:hypothetical protein